MTKFDVLLLLLLLYISNFINSVHVKLRTLWVWELDKILFFFFKFVQIENVLKEWEEKILIMKNLSAKECKKIWSILQRSERG